MTFLIDTGFYKLEENITVFFFKKTKIIYVCMYVCIYVFIFNLEKYNQVSGAHVAPSVVYMHSRKELMKLMKAQNQQRKRKELK